jgi:nitroimidazol reductase NimA-like FMN-containing flavoprotein (pyridoxamine 5'-phosphate oxidase superfamily)
MAKRSTVAAQGKVSRREPKASRPHAPGYGIAEANKGDGLLPWEWAVGLLEKPENYWVATVHPAGRPHVMPVWGVWLDNAFYFSTGRKSRKGRNLASNAECVVCNDNTDEAVVVEGTAAEVKDRAELKKLVAAYKKKYEMDPTSMEEPIFVVRPRTVFGLIEKKFPDTATRWTFS